MSIPFIEENDQTIARREHLEALRELVGNTYPNKFERSEIVEPGKEDTITAIVEKFRDFEPKRRAEQVCRSHRGSHCFATASDGQDRVCSLV